MGLISRMQYAFLDKIPDVEGNGAYWRVNSTFHLQKRRFTTFSKRSLLVSCVIIVGCVSKMQSAGEKMQNTAKRRGRFLVASDIFQIKYSCSAFMTSQSFNSIGLIPV